MDNVNSKDIENYAAKMDEKYADRGSDKLGFKEFKEAFAEAAEKQNKTKQNRAEQYNSRNENYTRRNQQQNN